MEKINVTRSSMPKFDEYVEEIKDLWDTRWLTNVGQKHQKLQKQLLSYLNVKNVELFTNGHLALEVALQALNLEKGGEVITTPFTFASTTLAIVRNGLKPVFCDINGIDYTMDVSKIENLITDKTVAIMPVHVYGNICDVEEIERISKKYNLKVLYDAAHAFGVKFKGKGIAEYGDVSMFSFHATKVFNTIEGGSLCFADSTLTNKIFSIRNFGITSQETVGYVGTNAKMNEFQAAMGLCNLRHIDEEIKKRKKIVERYISNLTNIKGIKVNEVQKDVQSNYAYFPIVVDEKIFGVNRDDIFEELAKNDINARKYFYPLTNSFDCFNHEYDVNNTPIALKISHQVLTLPLYADLALEDVDRICNIIKNMEK